MKNRILISLIILLLIINIGAITYYNKQLSNEHKVVLNLENDSKTKSTKIARLEGIIQNKDEIIKQEDDAIRQSQKVIDNQKNEINKHNVEINNQKNEVTKLQNKINELQKQVNFKREKKGSDVEGRKITVEATAYTAYCSEGCQGETATGVDVSSTIYYKGYRVVAVDASQIPLNSLVKVETKSETFTAMAIDTGGAIRGNRIDVLVGSESIAEAFGRQKATLTILKEGSN